MATKAAKPAAKPKTPAKASAAKPAAKPKTPARRATKRRKQKQIRIGFWPVLGVIGALILLISIPHLRHLRDERGAAIPKGSVLLMMDISHHQKSVQWDSLKIATDAKGRTIRSLEKATRLRDLEYIVMKATEGENFVDERFSEYWQAAREAGLRRGAYLFFLANRDPRKQAYNYIRTVGELRHKDLPPVVDAEVKPRSMSNERYSALVLECLRVLEEHYGRKPVIYSSDNMLTTVFSDKVLAYPVWVAHYDAKKPVIEDWLYWQFTDRAVVHGVEGHVDLSVLR